MAFRLAFGKRFALACLAFAAVTGGHGQTITLRNTTSNTCQYTSLSLAADRSIEVQCATSEQSSPGSISFSSPGGSSVSDTASGVAVTVTRFGNSGTASTATVAYACSATGSYVPQYSNGSSGSLSVTGNGTQSFTITPTPLPAGVSSSTISCVLSNAQVASLVSPTSFSLIVTASGGGGGGGGGSNCTGAATAQFYDLVGQAGSRAKVVDLRNGQTASVRFSAKRVSEFGSRFGINLGITMPIPGYAYPADGWEVAISECQGVFNSPPPGNTLRPSNCGYFETSSSGNIKTRAADPFYFWTCRLDPDKNYFLNIRWLNPVTNAATCPAGACSAYVDLSYQD